MVIKKTKSPNTTDFSKIAHIIEPVPAEQFVNKSFLSYAYMVILSRALPDARDGMKPVQRRVLYAMSKMGLKPPKKHVKSARIVGEVMGNYHPHGSSYGTLVRLSQGFSLALPLVDGHGNFGGGPGDGPASDRYTEARLAPSALYLLDEVKENVVPMVPNYTSETTEPSVLPAQFPNLLINGATGIAVGMACNLPPHNPDEIIAAASWLLKHPNASVEKMIELVPGPDFPTGGLVIGTDAIAKAYETGRGIVRIRARHHVEPLGRGKHNIVFTEMPYETSIEGVIEQLKNKLDEGKLQGIADAKDLSDRENGTKFVVETKAGINPNALAGELFTHTGLEISYGINNTVITPEGNPETLGIRELLQIFLDFRIEIVKKRTTDRLAQKQIRLHRLDALLKALVDIDKVIKIIRSSENEETARNALMKSFKLDSDQANYVLEIPLKRLTKYDRLELEKEDAEIKAEIDELKKILGDDSLIRKIVGEELARVGKQISTPRKSEIVGVSLVDHKLQQKEEVKQAVVMEDSPCVISFLPATGKAVRADRPAKNAMTVSTTTMGNFIAVTTKGRGFKLEALHVGERSSELSKILPAHLNADEKIIAILPLTLEEGKVGGLAMGTKKGIVKVQDAKWPKTQDQFDVISLDSDDYILGARWMEDNTQYDFVFMTSDSSLLTFPADKVRPQGALSGSGVAGIKYDPTTTEVIDFSVVSHEEKETALVVSVSDLGNGKLTPFNLYPAKGRATGGVRTLKFLKGDSKVVYGAVSVQPTLKTNDGTLIDLPAVDARRDGSGKPLGGIPVKG